MSGLARKTSLGWIRGEEYKPITQPFNDGVEFCLPHVRHDKVEATLSELKNEILHIVDSFTIRVLLAQR